METGGKVFVGHLQGFLPMDHDDDDDDDDICNYTYTFNDKI